MPVFLRIGQHGKPKLPPGILDSLKQVVTSRLETDPTNRPITKNLLNHSHLDQRHIGRHSGSKTECTILLELTIVCMLVPALLGLFTVFALTTCVEVILIC